MPGQAFGALGSWAPPATSQLGALSPLAPSCLILLICDTGFPRLLQGWAADTVTVVGLAKLLLNWGKPRTRPSPQVPTYVGAITTGTQQASWPGKGLLSLLSRPSTV